MDIEQLAISAIIGKISKTQRLKWYNIVVT